MGPAWMIRGRGSGGRAYYSLSLFTRTLFSRYSIHTHAFTTTTNTTNEFDAAANRNSISGGGGNDNPPTKSNSPPHPIPNRPLRTDNSALGRRRPTTHPSQLPKSSVSENNPNRDRGGVDLLGKFKFGLENEGNDEGRAEAADADSPPPQDADEIFRKMKETGVIPNAVAMLDGLCKDGLVQEAMKLFGLMREKGTMPEVVIYTAVVEGFCKAHKFDDAIRIFRKMQNANIVPNAFSYGLLIQGLCKGKRLDDALEFSVEALGAGHCLNLATFTGLVNGFCREKGLEDAKSAIATLRQKGFFFDEKAVREYLDKKGPFLPVVWEAILGRKASQRSSLFD